jgi:hypothetical protein
MKKLLLIFSLLFLTFSFAQQNENNNTVNDNRKPPATISSMSAYPNPFSIKTHINFLSTKVQLVEFTVKNLLGKTVYREIINTKIGYNSIPFYRKDITKGMYIYSLQTDIDLISKRLIIR